MVGWRFYYFKRLFIKRRMDVYGSVKDGGLNVAGDEFNALCIIHRALYLYVQDELLGVY